MTTWGEAVWTARDLKEGYTVVDGHGGHRGWYPSTEAALAERERLGGLGVECSITPFVNKEVSPC